MPTYQGTYQPRVSTTGRAFTGGAGGVAQADGGSELRIPPALQMLRSIAGSSPSSGLPIRGPLLGWPVVLVPRRAGSREMFQKDSFSVHELSFGAIIFREKGI
jgi:hypothetical protein